MMNKSELNDLIVNIDNDIKLYSLKFDNYRKDFKNNFNIDVKISNERTMAAYASEVLFKWLNAKNYFVDLLVNEFSVKTEAFGTKTINSLNNEVNNESNTRSWKKRMYIDSYFSVKDLYYHDYNNLFIEYKMSNKFDFTQLAQDFLKFKFYTKYNKNNTIFAYALFSQKENYPTILSSKKDKFMLIPKSISSGAQLNGKTLFDGQDKVYIYLPDEPTIADTCVNNCLPDIETEKLFELLDKINIYANDENETLEQINEIIQLENDIFYKNKGMFNSNVLIAKKIIKNYKNIIKLYIVSMEKNIFSNVIKKYDGNNDIISYFDLNLSEDSKKVIINDAKGYFKNFQQLYFRKRKKDSLERGLSSNYQSSLVILIVLKVFAKVYKLRFETELESIFVDNNKDEAVDLNDVVTNISNELYEIYSKDEYKENITFLAFELMYIIINLYKKIFIIKNSEVIKYSVAFENTKKTKSIQTNLNKISQILDIKEEILYNCEDFRKKTIQIFERIIDVV